MQLNHIVYIAISSFMIVWALVSTWRKGKRIPTGVHLFIVSSFSLILVLALFPEIILWLQKVTGLLNVINFLIVSAIMCLAVVQIKLYEKCEKQRRDITLLVQELAIKNKERK